MNRQEYRQLAGLSRAVSVLQGWYRELSKAVAGGVSSWRASKVSVLRRTQNPALSEHAGSIPAPGIVIPANALRPGKRYRLRPRSFPKPTSKPTTPSQIAQVLAIRAAERDRELAAINCALRSGTAAKVLG